MFRCIQHITWLLVLFVAGGTSVHARDLLGRNIDEVARETTVRCLDHDELVNLVRGRTVIGESVKSHWFGVYYKKIMQKDGSLITKIYRKGGEQPLKVIKDEQWFVRKDGILCSKQDGEETCRKKVCTADGMYLSVLKDDGTINGVWSLAAEETHTSKK